MAKLIDLMPEEYQRKQREIKPRTLLVISIVLLVIPLLAFSGLRIYLANMKDRIEEISNQIWVLESQARSEIYLKALSLEKQLETISLLLDKHFYWSDIFELIEELTLPQVKFDNFSGDTSHITLQAKAPSYTVLAKQVKSFENRPEKFSKVDFSKASLTLEGGINFDIVLTLNEGALLK